MRLARDEENCFRVSEIGIPNYSDVVVLGKPQLTLGNNADGNDLIIAPPDQPTSWANISDPRFNFRILKGHTIDNLYKHRRGALQAYLGFGAMGVYTIEHGLDLIRDSLVVVGWEKYVLVRAWSHFEYIIKCDEMRQKSVCTRL